MERKLLLMFLCHNIPLTVRGIAHTCACTHACTHARTHAHTCKHTHACTYAHACTHNTHTHTHTHTLSLSHSHTHTHTHTHTHIHTYTHKWVQVMRVKLSAAFVKNWSGQPFISVTHSTCIRIDQIGFSFQLNVWHMGNKLIRLVFHFGETWHMHKIC